MIKNYLLVFVCICLGALECLGQTPVWSWAKSGGGTGQDDLDIVSADPNGNVYLTGNYMSHTVQFGSHTLTNRGSFYNFYLVKYDASGNVLWAVGNGGTNMDMVKGVATDLNGNVYISGNYSSGSLTFGTTTLTNVGGSGLFLVKYDSLGNVLWARGAGGGEYDDMEAVCTDSRGNALVTGMFVSASIKFGNITLTNSSNNEEAYTVKYDPLGNVLWAKQGKGASWDDAYGITTDMNNNVFITGATASPTLAFDTATLVNSGAGSDLFAVKYDSLGNLVWAHNLGGSGGYDLAAGIATDPQGNSYVTGYYDGDSIQMGSYTLFSHGSTDMFLAKYDVNGNVSWAQTAGSAGSDEGNALAVDGEGNVYIAGFFGGPTMYFGTTSLASTGASDAFVTKYDTHGNILWALNPHGTSDEQAKRISLDANANVYVCGYFYSTTLTFGTSVLTNLGSYDPFIAKLPGCVVARPDIITTGLTSFCTGDSAVLTSSGAYSYLWTNAATTASIVVKSTGNYAVTIYNNAGCQATSAPVAINVSTSYHAGTITAPFQRICAGNAETLTLIGGTDSLQWQWSATGDNFAGINGPDSNAFYVQPAQTIYYRVVAGAGACADTSLPFKLVVNAPPVPVVNTNDSLLCSGDSTQLCTSNNFTSFHWNTGDTSSCIRAKQAREYYVNVTDSNGCTAESNHVSISVYPVPSVQLIEQGDTLLSPGQINYQWLMNDSVIPYNNAEMYVVKQSGLYSVEVTDSNGCAVRSKQVDITVTGIASLIEDAEPQVLVYPNPFSVGSVQLTIPIAIGSEVVGSVLEVIDEQGRLVLQSKIKNLKSKIDLDVPRGVYWLRIYNEKVSVVRKMVKL